MEAAFRWRVLDQKWKDNLAELRKDGIPFDLVVFTGDLADWGHPTDYPGGVAFLKETCEALGVPSDRLFVVPGNHDIDRKIQPAAWAWMRKNIGSDPRAYSEWMAGGDSRAFRRNRRREQVLERQQAFWGAVTTELGRPELAPGRSPHGRLGYRQTLTLPGLTQPIHVIGLDTSWLAGDEHDAGELWLTEHQVARLTTTEAGAPLAGLRLALMHHRFADLADAAVARGWLADRVDLVLHGHQHEPTADLLQGPDNGMFVLAAGCLYEGDKGHRYANACQVIDLVLEENARPQRAQVRFRGWSAQSHFWGDDALLYQNAPGGLLSLLYGTRGWRFGQATQAPERREPEPHKVFIGRDSELARIAAAFASDSGKRVAIVAVQGMAGIGKTYLAHEFYARHPGRFGGYQHLVIDPEQPGTTAAWLTVLGERAGIDPKNANEIAVAQALRAQRVLVHVDNVDSAEAAELVASLSRLLGGVPMLVTGRYAELGTSAGSVWTRIELAPLDEEAALELLHSELEEAGITVPEADLRELVRQVAGLPLALHLAAGYLRRGTTVGRFLARLREQGLALGPHDPADHVLADRARGVLSTSFAISRELMVAEAEPRSAQRGNLDFDNYPTPVGSGPRSARWEALVALGWAPRAGFGRSLGAAITDLDEASGAFDDFMEAAVALSLVQALAARGEQDEALRILREEVLPAFERLGDVRSRAIALGKIADVWADRGELEEALGIRREEELPVYERLGDVRSRAITLGKIADVLAARGDLDVALAMWRESRVVFEQLAAPDLIAVAHQRIALLEALGR